MKRFNSTWAILVLFLCVTFTSMAQLKVSSVVPGDTLFYADFKLRPTGTTYPVGDLYSASTTNANKEAIYGGMTFGAGPNGQRINFSASQSANPFGTVGVTTYISETAADDGATSGSFQFIRAGTSGGGGYLVLPKVKGPCNITIWACDGSLNQQSYTVSYKENASGNYVPQTTTTIVAGKKIKKNTYYYSGTDSVQVKFTSISAASATNTALYVYNVAVVAAAPPTTPSITFLTGLTAQTVYQTQTLKPIVYQYGGTATSAPISWTGTSNVSTAPDGVIVTNNATAKTVTISGVLNTLGSYGYSITSSDGINTTAALTGTLNTKTTTKYKMAYVTTVTSGAPGALDLNFINGLSNNPGNDGFSKDFDLTYISSIDTGIDYSIYDLIVQSSIPSSADGGLAELKTKCLSKPFVNMKAFQLQSSRWNWLTPSNNTALNTITVPDSTKLHPLYNGIVFTGASNNEIQLTTLTTGNMLVTSAWLTTTTASANPRVLATAQALPAAYDYMEIPVGTTMNGMSSPTLAKQMILGLSEATYGALTVNAVTLAVNAAKYVVAPVPTISLTSGSNAQTLHANAAIANVVYTYGGTVTATNVVWTGTANATTAPAGIAVVVDAVAKTITFSGAPTAEGVYGYTVSSTDGAAIPSLTGTLTVSIGTGVQSTLNAKTVTSTEFYDVTGKKVSEYSHGLLIEKTIYTDGSISFNKIYRSEF